MDRLRSSLGRGLAGARTTTVLIIPFPYWHIVPLSGKEYSYSPLITGKAEASTHLSPAFVACPSRQEVTKRDDKKVMSPALLFSRVPRRLLCRRTNQYTFTLAPDVTPLHILSVATPSRGAVKGGKQQRGRAVGGPNKAGSALAQASSRYLPAEATANVTQHTFLGNPVCRRDHLPPRALLRSGSFTARLTSGRVELPAALRTVRTYE